MKAKLLIFLTLLFAVVCQAQERPGRYDRAAIKLTLEKERLTIELDKARIPEATTYLTLEAFVPGGGGEFYADRDQQSAVVVIGVVNHSYTGNMRDLANKLGLKPGTYWLTFNAEEAGFASRILEYTYKPISVKNE